MATVRGRIVQHVYDKIWTLTNFDLKTRIARIARGSHTEGFPKSGHILWRITSCIQGNKMASSQMLTIHFTSYPGEERRGENHRGETSLHFLPRRGDERRGTRRDFTRHATLHTQKPILDSWSKTVLNRPCTICIGSGICGARLYRCRIPVPDSIQNLDLGTTRIYDDTDLILQYEMSMRSRNLLQTDESCGIITAWHMKVRINKWMKCACSDK